MGLFFFTVGAIVALVVPWGSAKTFLVRLLADDANQNPATASLPEVVREVAFESSHDGTMQKALWAPVRGEAKRPLILSFPTWSGGYTQPDPLVNKIVAEDWNYMRPDLRGPNKHPESCLSEAVLSDIDDAIRFAINSERVDLEHIYIVGESGGGHAALGAYLRSDQPIAAILTWVPITDLEAWYWQSKDRGLHYANDVLNVVSGEIKTFDVDEARKRSPLFMPLSEKSTSRHLEIYAGLRDGYGKQSVPISHSIQFFNRMAHEFGYPAMMVTLDEGLSLMSRGISRDVSRMKIGGRVLFYKREIPNVSLFVFDGGHEMLDAFCFDRLKELVRERKVGRR